MKNWIRAALVIVGCSTLLIPLLLRGAQDPPADPPAESAPAETPPPASAPAEEANEEEELAPGERLSADNNLSWPVDI